MKLALSYRYWHVNGNREFKPGKDKEDVKGDQLSISATVTEYCCEEMGEAWGDFVGFGEYLEYFGNKDTNINIGSWTIYGEDSYPKYKAIRYCPFCGRELYD
jgi:hypothetical protein